MKIVHLILGFLLVPVFLSAPNSSAATASDKWSLTNSTLTYTITHLVHKVEGTSHGAKGKVACEGNQCQVLVAAPVDTFDSGNSNRDSHMQEATKAKQFPIVSVVGTTASLSQEGTLKMDLKITFAGETYALNQQEFQLKKKGADEMAITGKFTVPIEVFKLERPALLGVKVEDKIDVAVETAFKRAN